MHRLGLLKSLARTTSTSMLSAALVALLAPAVGYCQSDSSVESVGYGSLAILTPHVDSRMVSPENPTGERGKGATRTPDPSNPDLAFSGAASELGRGWKVRPFIKIAPHTTATIMDVEGSGTIKHIWMATSADLKGVGRANVLRFYWDGEANASIEVPLSDFFAIGHERFAPVNSAMVVDNPASAMNCYWPMPFRKHAKPKISPRFSNDRELYFAGALVLLWLLVFLLTHLKHLNLHK